MADDVKVLVYLGFVVWSGFCLLYAVGATWWRSAVGRNVMGVAFAIACLLALIAAQVTWPDYWLRPWLQRFVYGGLILLGVQRAAQLIRAQRGTRIMETVKPSLAARIKQAWQYLTSLEPVYVATVWRAVVGLAAAVGLSVSTELDGMVVAGVAAFFVLLDALQSRAVRAKGVPVAKLPDAIVELAKDGPLPESPAAVAAEVRGEHLA